MLPDQLLHYRVLQPLGSGGMGDVYLAEDTKLGRRVALKVLPGGDVADPERRQRFEREAKAVAALNHPNIVTIHAVEQAGDITFLTMELVEGRTLSAVIPKSGLAVEPFLKIAIPLADAVTAAHERGITHRDLKPANVMVTNEGRVKVLDFGLAKLAETSAGPDAAMTALKPEPLTGEGRIVGTVAYMSPEQAEGKPLDHRTDLFSLGVLMFEMATGSRPFTGDTNVSILSAILKDAPRSVTELNPAMPRDLARIIRRALVKDQDHRYQTAKDLRNDLETLKEDLASGSADMPAPALPAPAARKLSPAVLAIAGVVGIGILGWVGWTMLGNRPSTPETVERAFDNPRLTRLTSTGKVTMAAISADGRYVVHVVSEGAKQGLWLRQTATPSNVPIVAPADVRYDGVTFSRDGNFVYYTVYPQLQSFSTVYQVPVLGGPPRKILDDADSPLAFSPDGTQVAFLRGYQRLGESAIMIASADGTNERKLLVRKHPQSFLLSNIAWSPDGSTIVAIRRDEQGRSTLVAASVSSGAEAPVGDRAWAFIDSVAWMPGGRALVAGALEDEAGASSQIWYIPYPSGEPHRLTNDLNGYGGVTVSADGRTISAVQREGLAHLWVGPTDNVAAARQITSGTGRVDGGPGLCWTPDGRILYSSNASGNYDIWVVDATGANSRQLTVDPAHDGSPQVTPDGRTIVFSSSRHGGSVWQMDPDGGNQRPIITSATVAMPLVSADSQWLYYTSFAEPQRRIFRMPLTGGPAERLTAAWPEHGISEDGIFYHPTATLVGLSRDGTTGVITYADAAQRGWRAALVSMTPGQPSPLTKKTAATIEPQGLGSGAFLRDGRHVVGIQVRDGVPVLVRWPIGGGAPAVLGTFTAESFVNFALSSDGKQIALARGTTTSDVVLVVQQGK